jgi:hypothetical protein
MLANRDCTSACSQASADLALDSFNAVVSEDIPPISHINRAKYFLAPSTDKGMVRSDISKPALIFFFFSLYETQQQNPL